MLSLSNKTRLVIFTYLLVLNRNVHVSNVAISNVLRDPHTRKWLFNLTDSRVEGYSA